VNAGAQLSVTDQRRSARHPVDYRVDARHLPDGWATLHIRNMSTCGFMIDNADNVSRGDRMLMELPMVGQIEAYCMWMVDTRAGFQFERIIRPDEFSSLICEMQPNPALWPRG
jgi:hypothetical protein